MIKLLKHQIEDAAKMVERGHALNYSLPGTGKTLTSLHAFGLGGYERGLILAPPLALTMWAQEITKFTGMSVQVLRNGKTPIVGEPDFIVTTYALATAGQSENIEDYFLTDRAQVMILDESHYLKSRYAKRTLGVFGKDCAGRACLFDLFDQVWSLTGTPVTRYYDDLWAQLRPTKPDVLSDYGVDTYDRWVLTFCATQVKRYHPKQRPQRVVVANRNPTLLRKVLDDCGVIRRTLVEVVEDMPPITQRDISINNAAVAKLARTLKMTEAQIKAGLEKDDPQMIVEWRKLGMARLDDVADYIAECAKQGPVLAGHWFREFGSALATALHSKHGLKVAEVNGSTPSARRDEIRDLFNASAVDVLVGQIGAMNTSWNIQEASSHVIMAEDIPSPGVAEQFIARIHRMGQKHHVQVDWIKSAHPIDKVMVDLRERKVDGVERIL